MFEWFSCYLLFRSKIILLIQLLKSYLLVIEALHHDILRVALVYHFFFLTHIFFLLPYLSDNGVLHRYVLDLIVKIKIREKKILHLLLLSMQHSKVSFWFSKKKRVHGKYITRWFPFWLFNKYFCIKWANKNWF